METNHEDLHHSNDTRLRALHWYFHDGADGSRRPRTLAQCGNVLIKRWGAATLLREVPQVIILRVSAPMEFRVRVMIGGAHDERSAMVAEVLRDQVLLEVEAIDRMYSNVYVPHLQSLGAVVGYLRVHRGQRFASTMAVMPMTEATSINSSNQDCQNRRQ
jgi:hypothetical protein